MFAKNPVKYYSLKVKKNINMIVSNESDGAKKTIEGWGHRPQPDMPNKKCIKYKIQKSTFNL